MNLDLPRMRFAHLPTAIENMPRLSAALGGYKLMVKRDDQTGLGLGGNKTRKLEFIIADAIAQKAHTLITSGAIQSNHVRQTAAAAAHFNFDCILVLTGEPPTFSSGNLFLDELFDAEIVWTNAQGRDQCIKQVYDQAEKNGRKPYLIPGGGSNPLGVSAYALAIQELLDQIGTSNGELPMPDWIVFASSSGGTQAGLILGSRLFGFSGKILGISIIDHEEYMQKRIATLVNETSSFLGEKITIKPEDILINGNYLGSGYAQMGKPEEEAIHLFARTEGLLVDPVYTGRAAAGLIDLIHHSYFSPDQTILFWHTGGIPALFADTYQKQFRR